MKHLIAAVVAAGALSAATLGLAGAATAATTGAPSPTDTVKQLEARGYEVITTTVSGNDPQRCSIASVRPGQTMMGNSKEIHGVQTPTLLHKTVYVDLRC
jgi:ABC-type xylose transport system substrate-binding protein